MKDQLLMGLDPDCHSLVILCSKVTHELYPSKFNFLENLISSEDGVISTLVLYKPTDSHSYLTVTLLIALPRQTVSPFLKSFD